MHEMTAHRSLKEKQRQEREALILQVAEEVLLEKGYHDASMDEIAARVGIAKGTLYLHFARKEDLVLALLGREVQAVLRIIEQTMTMEGTAREKLTFILNARYQALSSTRARIFYIIHDSPDLQSVLKEKKEMWEQTLGRIMESITTLLDEGKANGEFDATLPTAAMLSIFFGIFFSVLSPRTYASVMRDKSLTLDEFMQCVENIYFRGISAAPLPPEKS